eukprot:TRINITY_DN2144_c0_g1_i2.p1 TRINITY_DN2144_c0_g1~~TRINITY_DN2144_c0_g1_i2.p1  ORF type:complete len:182 (-),score=38.49 TRINITY_DN2144_c0_g1_i2:40-585(-)
MTKMLFFCLSLLLALCSGSVLVRKSIGLSSENPTPAVDTDVLLSVQVFNRGETPVYDVQLTDYVPKDFEVVSGSVKTFWQEIPAGANFTHTYVLRTNKLGQARFSWATLTYRPTLTSQEVLTYSNYLGTADVVPANQVAQHSGPNFRAWSVFFLIYLAVVGGPFMMYKNTQAQFVAKSKSD